MKHKLRFWCILLVSLGVLWACWRLTGCDLGYFLRRSGHLTDLVVQMFPPDRSFFKTLALPLLTTIRMSVTGTALGAFLALLAAPFCASNLGGNGPLRLVLRLLVQVLRSFPALILALAATFLFGLGSFSGTLALTIFTFAIMTRLTYEDAEAAPLGAYHALTTMGIRRIPAFYRAVLPQILPSYLTNALYLLETNVRHSSILGYVGAGGIGLLLNEKISWREYAKVGTILISLFLAVCLIEWLAETLVAVVRGEKSLSGKGRRILRFCLLALFLFCTFTLDPPDFSHTAPRIAANLFRGLTHPDWSYFFASGEAGLGRQLLETVGIALLGTVLGAFPAFILALLNTRRFMPKVPALFFRLFIMIIRSVPFIIYGLIFIRVTGAGAFAGVLTMGMCSIGLLSKRFTEAIEALDLRAYHALCVMGTGKFTAMVRAVFPQLWPVFLSSVLYRFDVNLREAAILGLVGAGGIGATLILSMNKYAWNTTGAIFLGLILLVWIIDRVSGSLRAALKH